MPHFKNTPLAIVTCLFLCGSPVESVDVAHINDITALTLKTDTWTTANRLAPVQQLQCVGGNAMDMAHHVRLVQCVKVGSNGNTNQWKCNANFPHNLPIDLERTDVTCEGYTDRKDPYKVVGSCGLLYTLVRRSHYNTNYHSPTYDYDDDDTGGVFVVIFMIGLLLWFGSVICGGGGGNCGGGGGGGFDGRNNRREGLSNSASYWSGAATGAAASSLWNSRRTHNRYNTGGSGNSSTSNNWWSSTTRTASGTRKSDGFGTTIDR